MREKTEKIWLSRLWLNSKKFLRKNLHFSFLLQFSRASANLEVRI